MKFIIDEIIYYDEKNPKIEISWSIIHTDGTKKPFLNEVFKWRSYPEILSPSMLLKMKPLRDEEEEGDENNLFLGHYSQTKRLQKLVEAQLNITKVLIANHLNIFKTIPTATWKNTPPDEPMTPDELRVLYPLSYVIYSEHLLSDGKPCRVPLYMVCHNGMIDAEPAPSMLREFRPPHSLRHILFHSQKNKSSELATESSNSEPNDSHEQQASSSYSW
ncbi:hypothetical protein [Legionella rowbothamii]|uniref:hypothetical protein n=1 Tax=Legionella rowbothamii TaxID=96229 RepID=UPI001055107D|nr:hypothetical protein [Legionella rowbothamii]